VLIEDARLFSIISLKIMFGTEDQEKVLDIN